MINPHRIIFTFIAYLCCLWAWAEPVYKQSRPDVIYLDSKAEHHGAYVWKMKKASELTASMSELSKPGYDTNSWTDAVVPGTLLRR